MASRSRFSILGQAPGLLCAPGVIPSSSAIPLWKSRLSDIPGKWSGQGNKRMQHRVYILKAIVIVSCP